MLSPRPDPDPRPASLTRAPRCRRRASVTCRLNWHLLPTPTDTSFTADLWPLPVAVRLTWTRHEPHAVRVSFHTGARPVVWTIGRDLLDAGLLAPVGLGDVAVLPDPPGPALGELVLSTASEHACCRFLTAEMAGYLARLPAPPGTSPAVMSLLRAVSRHDEFGEAR